MSRWHWGITTVLVLILAMDVTHGGVNPPAAAAAATTSFTPSSVSSLPATITITTAGVDASTQSTTMTLVFPTNLTITPNTANLQCVGIFQGAAAVVGPVEAGPSAGTAQVQLGCGFPGATTVSGASGNVMSFTLLGSGNGTVSLLTTGPKASLFVNSKH